MYLNESIFGPLRHKFLCIAGAEIFLAKLSIQKGKIFRQDLKKSIQIFSRKKNLVELYFEKIYEKVDRTS